MKQDRSRPTAVLRTRRVPRAFTLVEVLAALLLIAIVLPVVMQGMSIGTSAASMTRRRAEAGALAETKLAELVTTGQWQDGNATGDFGPDWPDYRWEATIGAWEGDSYSVGLQQVDVRVIWNTAAREESVSLSTLAYVRNLQ